MTAFASLTVFVSSTWLDLVPERGAVRDLTLRMNGLRFLGMEHFGSRDEDTAQVSLLEVERGDLYVGIIGGRYGSGITEREYERASGTGKPCFIYFKRARASALCDDDSKAKTRLQEFISKLRRAHTCSEFDTAEELALKLSVDLHNWLFQRQLARGLSRLSVEYLARVQAFISEYIGTPDHPTPFGGRVSELAILDTWLDDPAAPPYLLVTAGAGRGKSALLVRWTQRLLGQGSVVPLFFPISIRFRTNLANVFFASLTSYLASLHDEQLSVNPDTPPEVWRARLTELLARPLSGGRRLLLVLDGLDEAADWEVGADLFPTQLGAHARVVVSARLLGGDLDAKDWLRRLGWLAPHGAYTLPLAGLSNQGVADVLERMGAPLAQLGARAEIVHELHRLSEGDPLLVRLYVDDLLKRAPLAARLQVADLRAIAPGLDGYFERWWDDQRKLWGETRPMRERRVQLLLELLAGALGPLSRDDLLALAPAELDSWLLVDAMEPLDRFIVGDGIHNGFVFSHPRLGIYWRERLPQSERDRLEERFLRWGESEVESAERDSTHSLSSYAVQYFGAHLDRHSSPAIRYRPMLTDSWRRAWVSLEGANSGYRADLHRVAQAVHASCQNETDPGTELIALAARCALCIASVEEVSRTTPVELIAPLVERRVWGRQGALRFARSIEDPMRRAIALARLVGGESPVARVVVMLEIIDTLRECVAREERFDDEASERIVSLLGDLAAEMPPEAIDAALELALTLQKRSLMIQAVRHLLPRLGPGQVQRVLQTAVEMQDEELRLRLLGEVARRHGGAVAALSTQAATKAWERAWILLACTGSDGDERASGFGDAMAACLSALPHLPARLEAAERELLLTWTQRSGQGLDMEHAARLFDSLVHAAASSQKLRQLTGLVASSRDDKLNLDAVELALDTLSQLEEPGAWFTGAIHLQGALTKVDASDPRLVEALDVLVTRAAGSGGRSALPSEWEPRLANIAVRLPAGQGKLLEAVVRRVDDPVELVEALVPWATSLEPVDLVWLASEVCLSADAGAEWKHQWLKELAPHLSTTDFQMLFDRLVGQESDTMLAVVAALPARLPKHLDSQAAMIVLRALDNVYLDEGDERHAELWAASTDAEGAAMVSRELAIRGRRDGSVRRLLIALAPRLERDDLVQIARSLQAIKDDPSRLFESCLKSVTSQRVTGVLTDAWNTLGTDARAALLVHWWARGDDRTQPFYERVVAAILQASSEERYASALLLFVEHGGTPAADDLAKRIVVDSGRIAVGRSRSARSAAMLAPRVSDGVLLHHFDWFLAGLLVAASDERQILFDCVNRVPAECFIRAFEAACQRIVERKVDPDDESQTSGLTALAQLASRMDSSEMPLAKPMLDAMAASPERDLAEASLQFDLGRDGSARLGEEIRNFMMRLKRPGPILRAALGWSARASEEADWLLVLELIAKLPTAGEAVARVAESVGLRWSGPEWQAAMNGAWGCVLMFNYLERYKTRPPYRLRQLAERELMRSPMVDHQGIEPPPLLPLLARLLPMASEETKRNVLAATLRVVRARKVDRWRYRWLHAIDSGDISAILGSCLPLLGAAQVHWLWRDLFFTGFGIAGCHEDMFVEPLSLDIVRSLNARIPALLADLGDPLYRWAPKVMQSLPTTDLLSQPGMHDDGSALPAAASVADPVIETFPRVLDVPEHPAAKMPQIASWFSAAKVSRSEVMALLAREIEDAGICEPSTVEAIVVATQEIRAWWP